MAGELMGMYRLVHGRPPESISFLFIFFAYHALLYVFAMLYVHIPICLHAYMLHHMLFAYLPGLICF